MRGLEKIRETKKINPLRLINKTDLKKIKGGAVSVIINPDLDTF